MFTTSNKNQATVVYFSHGGGPLPILGDKGHSKMVSFLKDLAIKIKRPDAIVVFSAHWEQTIPTILGSQRPNLYFDYYGFPKEAYTIDYPLPGNPELSERINDLFRKNHIESRIDYDRGFDHGVFIPLKIMYPDADIPTIQISLIEGLDPIKHIQMGKALKELTQENILIFGSGFSFHNLQLFSWNDGDIEDKKNDAFQDALINLCIEEHICDEIENKLINWKNIPYANYCHPREDHLIPLHICFGVLEKPGQLVFNDYIMGKRSIAILWQ